MAEGGPSPQEGVDSNHGIRLNVALSHLKKLLECPVCYDTILPPITLCGSGHSVCNYCRGRLADKKCPTCRSNFSNVRDIFAEFFLDSCSLACKFQEFGCAVELPGTALADHQRACEFRLIICHSCGQQVQYQKLLQHLMLADKFQPHVGSECTGTYDLPSSANLDIPGRTCIWEPIWLKAFETNFFCFLQCCSGSWWVWVGVYAPEEDCDKFTCAISIDNKTTGTEVKYRGFVHQIRTNPTAVFTTGKCLIFPHVQLSNLKDQGGLHVSVAVGLNQVPNTVGDQEDFIRATVENNNVGRRSLLRNVHS